MDSKEIKAYIGELEGLIRKAEPAFQLMRHHNLVIVIR